jgi:hypothetical protein
MSSPPIRLIPGSKAAPRFTRKITTRCARNI